MTDNKENTALTPFDSLKEESSELINQLVNESDTDKVEDLTKLFVLNQRKKEILRLNKLSNLLNDIDDKVAERVNSDEEYLDNDQLIKYMSETNKVMTNIKQSITQTPTIQINNQTNEVNINGSGLTRESRQRVLDVVNSILTNQAIDAEFIEKEDEE